MLMRDFIIRIRREVLYLGTEILKEQF